MDLNIDFLPGHIPILPWVKQPSQDAATLLAAIQETHDSEIQHVCKKFAEAGGILKSVKELALVLGEASKIAEEEIAKKYCKTKVKKLIQYTALVAK